MKLAMISLSQLNRLIYFSIFSSILIFNAAFATTAVDIWKKKEVPKELTDNEEEEEIDSSILSDEQNNISIKIDEEQINETENSVIGIFDPEENDFTLDMWSNSNGEDIKNILKRINKLKLSEFSENLLFQVLFTNAYPPKTNLNSKEFSKIKVDWLIKNRRFKDLEILLKNNPEVGQEPKAIKFLVNEYLSSANVSSACEKASLLDKGVDNNYLDKFIVYCLINNDQKNEAQLVLELLREKGLSDKFFESKINFFL